MPDPIITRQAARVEKDTQGNVLSITGGFSVAVDPKKAAATRKMLARERAEDAKAAAKGK